MAILSLQDILDADSFSFGTETLSQISADNIAKNKDINLEGLSITSASILDDLFATSAKSDGSSRPKQISYQPLAEAVAATSGGSQPSSALGAIANNSQAFLDTSKEYIDKSGQLNPDFYEGANFSKEQIIDANRILSTGAMALSNSTEKANGGIIFSAATDFKLAGNNVYLGSESILHTASPVIVSNAKVGQYQENFRSVTFDAEHKIGKSAFKQVDFNHRIASFDHKLTAQSDKAFSKDMERNATRLNRTAGDQTQIFANSHLESASANTNRNTARGSMVHQAGDIAIAASSSTGVSSTAPDANGSTPLGTPQFIPPNGCITIAATGDKTNIGSKTKGNINIVSSSKMTQASNEMVEMSESLGSFVKTSARILAKDVLHQAWGSFTGLAKGKNQVFLGNDMSSIVVKKKRITINPKIKVDWKMPNPKIISIPELLGIPALPELPTGLTEEDLTSCIPERYRKSTSSTNTPPSNTSKSSIPEEQRRNNPTYDPYCKTECVVPTTSSNGGNTGNLPVATVPNTLPSPVLMDKAKLPTNTITSSDESSKTQDRKAAALNVVTGTPVGAVKGGLDIFINRPDQAQYVLNPMQPNSLADPLENYSDVLVDNKSIDDLIQQAQLSAAELTKSIITINAKRLGTPVLTVKELETNLSVLKTFNSLPNNVLYALNSTTNIEALNATDAERVKAKALLALPGAAILISAAFKELNISIGIGFLGSILSFAGDIVDVVGDVSGVVSDVINVVSNVGDILSGGFNLSTLAQIAGVSLGNLGSVAGALTSSKGLGLSGFINAFTPSLQNLGNIGQSLLNGVGGSAFADTFNVNIENSIETASTQALSKVLGSNIDQAVPGLTSILKAIKPGTSLDKTKVLGQIQTVLSSVGITVPEEVNKVYDSLSDVINGLSSGNVAEVLSGGSLRSLLSHVLGPTNISVLDDVANAVGSGTDLFKSLSKIPALLEMMNNYDIPLLDQISSILACVDIIQQVEELFHSVEDIFDDDGGQKTDPQLEEILQLFEDLPRLVQTLQGIQTTPEQVLIDMLSP